MMDSNWLQKLLVSLFFILVILLFTNQLIAQQTSSQSDWKTAPNIILETFDQLDGLPVVSLTDLVLGADNHIYVASSGGVSRFNGSHFEEISTEIFPELNSNRILYLHATADSAIWMIDEQYFFSRWKHGRLSTFDNLFKNEAQSEWMLRASNSGSVWISNGEEFLVFNEKTGFKTVPVSLPGHLYDFIPVSDTLAFILTDNGLLQLRKNQLSVKVPFSELPINPDTQDVIYQKTKLQEISHERIIIFDYRAIGVYHINQGTYRKIDYPSEIKGTPPSVLEVSPSLLLLHALDGHFDLDLEKGVFVLFPGTAEDEIWDMNYHPIWKDKRLYISESSVFHGYRKIFKTQNEERITQAIQDREGNLWLSVAGRGLIQINLNNFNILSTETGLQSNNTYTILKDSDSNIWLASYEFGIHKINGQNISYWSPANQNLANNLIRSLYEKKNGTIIAATWDDGMYQYNGGFWTPFLINNSALNQVESFYEYENGDFWIGSRLGLYKKKAGSNVYSEIITPDGKPILRTQVIQPYPKGKLWLGTHGQGLLLYQNETIKNIRFDELEIQPKIRDIYFSSEDTLWLATENSGLIRAILNNSDQVISYSSVTNKDNLPDIGVHRILTDRHGFFWITSNQGVSRVRIRDLNNYLDGFSNVIWIETFTENDGLPIRETNGGTYSNGIVDDDGKIWIPTQKGVIQFDPEEFLNRNPFKNTGISVSSIRTGDSFYNLSGINTFTLPTGKRSITVEFDLVHYTTPEDIILEYRIPSISDTWNQLSNDRQLSISNLSPGTHRIEMRIAHIPEELHEVNTFLLTVPYYYYELTWFYIPTIALLLSLIGALFVAMRKAAQKRELILNERVSDRTKLLQDQKAQTEAALVTIQKQAGELEKLNQAKTNFFISMTHELRTPLTLIKGPLNLLKDASRRNDINQEEQLELIERNSTHLNDVVDQLLDLLRLETEPHIQSTKKIDLIEFVRLQASQFQSSEELKNKSFEFTYQGSDLFIITEPESLTLIVNNLISNAIKYTNKHDRIDVKVYPKENNFILEVSDTGIGISDSDKQFIFDPFYRSDNARHKKGSGIGLGIVKNFIDRFGGDIEIQSELNSGTSIRISFPKPSTDLLNSSELYNYKSTKPNRIALQNSQSNGVATIQKKTGDKISILLVEDNPDLRLFLRRLLENKYEVHTQENGIAAIEYLEHNTPQLIITDVMMPEMDGITFIQKVRSNKKLRFIPAIILSAKKSEESITEGLLSGAQVYLTKPLENKIFLAQIESLLEREIRLQKTFDIPVVQKPDLQIRVDELILRHISNQKLSVQEIAKALHMSRPTLYRKWKEIMDDNLNDYIVKTRLKEAVKLVKEKKYTFAEASIVCGFSDPSYFSRVFKKFYKMSPSSYFSKLKKN